jgi:hypothetical protein
MKIQSENNKKTWQEPELKSINILGGPRTINYENRSYNIES